MCCSSFVRILRSLFVWSFVVRRGRPDAQRYGACSMASSLFKSAWATPMSGTRTVASISARTMIRFISYPSLLSHFLGGRPRGGRCYAFLLKCFGTLTQSCCRDHDVDAGDMAIWKRAKTKSAIGREPEDDRQTEHEEQRRRGAAYPDHRQSRREVAPGIRDQCPDPEPDEAQ